MSSPVITVAANATGAQIAELLTDHKISAAPVVDDAGNVLGLVRQQDLLASPGGDAAEAMTTVVISVTEDCSVSDIRHLLVERRIGRVLVLRDGRLVGVVSRRDVVATMAIEWACQVCGEPVRGDQPPAACPKCHADRERFVLQEQSPGT